jgi:hypothetical protein
MVERSSIWGFVTFLSILVVACGVGPKLARVPKTPDIIIKADEIYLEGEEQERDLALKHYKSLEAIIAEVRNAHPLDQFEFFERQVGFFKGPKGEEGSYLGLGAFTEERFDTSTTNRNKRVATVFAKYGKSLLEIMAGQEEVFQDERLKGFKLYLTYWKKNVAKQLYGKGETEWVEFFLAKKDIRRYLARDITDQALLDSNHVFMESGRVKIVMGEAL